MCVQTHTRGCGVTGGDDNTVRHKHKVQESGEKRRQQGDGGPLTALTTEERAAGWGPLTGMSQAPNCARLGRVPAQSSGVPEH